MSKKPLTKFEKEVCELTWGGIPVDVDFIRNSELFKQKFKEMNTMTKTAEEIKAEIENYILAEFKKDWPEWDSVKLSNFVGGENNKNIIVNTVFNQTSLLQKENVELKEQNKLMEHSIDEQILELQKENEELKSKVSGIHELLGLNTELSLAEHTRILILGLRQEVSDLTSHLQSKQAEIESFQKERIESERLYQCQTDTITKKQAEIDGLKKMMDELNEILDIYLWDDHSTEQSFRSAKRVSDILTEYKKLKKEPK